jgi:hypothetical protein
MEAHVERWRPVGGWPYEVSDLGRVRRAIPYLNSKPGGILCTRPGANGYLRVSLSRNNRVQTAMVHSLVAGAFLGPKPSCAHIIAHYDGDRTNSAAANLRWATRVENEADKARHGRKLVGERVHGAKCTAAQVDEIRRSSASIYVLGPKYGLSPSTIARIRGRVTWKHV